MQVEVRNTRRPAVHHARPTSDERPPVSARNLINDSINQPGLRMLTRIRTEEMEVGAETLAVRILLKVKGEMAERVEGCDNPSGIAGDCGIDRILRVREGTAVSIGSEITAAITQLIEMPIAALILRTEIGKMMIHLLLDQHHVSAKVTWQKIQPLILRYHSPEDGVRVVV